MIKYVQTSRKRILHGFRLTSFTKSQNETKGRLPQAEGPKKMRKQLSVTQNPPSSRNNFPKWRLN